MTFFHLADLHLGKRVNDFSMLEEQTYILEQIVNAVDDEKPNAILIAGDIYDKSVPPAEAVALFDRFLSELAEREVKVFIISGNHDSPERLAFAASIVSSQGIYISPVFNNQIKSVRLEDEYGAINIYLLPFIKPLHVKKYFPDIEIKSYDDALRAVINNLELNTNDRNIILAHQFVTGAERTESEEIFVGGSENISADIFDDFDYVALGHLHRPQQISRPTIRYSGSPLKYSFSEAKDSKSITVIKLGAKNNDIALHFIALKPKRDLCVLKGKYNELTFKGYYDKLKCDDYFHIILTDENEEFNALNKLRLIYPNIMKLTYDNQRTRNNNQIDLIQEIEEKSPLQLVEDFYRLQNNSELNEEQRDFVQECIEKIWEDL